MIAAGKLDQRIKIVPLTSTQNGAGDTIDTPDNANTATVWAAVRQQGAAEQTRNGITVGDVTYAIRVRHRAGVDHTCRVEYRGRALEVLTVVEAGQNNREWIDIIAKGPK